ncbi:Putative protein kinase superfamily protein [Klebsormidium nitens]|uniref:Protein kinase domain-containing protein n=1 Tax=Klebsormidium nitens TaxID=105231 RepID=A0A1Y1ILX7_KLENI|nr:Putative protein kinase superfamily protein [Klebsormidium nitens]|eukprot:GAQ90449.1 Putative protein kinase superfamily protein [Klebsormidium nitens]
MGEEQLDEAFMRRLWSLANFAEDQIGAISALLINSPQNLRVAKIMPNDAQLGGFLRQLLKMQEPQKEAVRVEEFLQLKGSVADLQLKYDASTRSSRTDASVGKFWRAKAVKIKDLPFLAAVADSELDQVANAVLERFPEKKKTGLEYAPVKSLQTGEEEAGLSSPSNKKRKGPSPSSPTQPKLPGYTLADCIPAARLPKFKEDAHMQPAVIKMVEAALGVLRSKLILRDTHDSSNQFIHPVGRPDLSLLAAALIAWTQLVSVGEFKLGEGTDDIDSMFGQLINRTAAILDSQPDRQRVVSFGLTMNSIEVVHVHRGQDRTWVVQTIGPLPFSISRESAGFKILIRLLATELTDLGFLQPEIPEVHLSRELCNLELLRRGQLQAPQGTAPNRVGSVVFQASTAGHNNCILKLCHSGKEGDVLNYLGQCEEVSNVVELLERGKCTYNGRDWDALLLIPVAVRLTQELPVQVLAQVTLDLAHAIDACLKVGVAHRDISLDNIGIMDGRGVLYDFSAAKFIDPKDRDTMEAASPSGKLEAITGTSRYAALSVLEGRSHTTSSMLESLYLSILSACCDEKLTGRHDMKIEDLQKCQIVRRGSMLALRPPDFSKVPSSHLGFVREMHELFYPLQSGSAARMYNVAVALDKFEEVCKMWMQPLTAAN